jgi:hypothetical protein
MTNANFLNLGAEDSVSTVGFTETTGGSIEILNDDSVILYGNYNDDKTGGSTLKANGGNDALYGGAGDVLDAGSGKNQIFLAKNRAEAEKGAMVVATAGINTVEGFNYGFNDDSDILTVGDEAEFSYVDGNVVIKNGTSKTSLTGSSDSSGDSVADYKEILVGNEDNTQKYAIGAEDAFISVGSSVADKFIGNNSGLDFSSYTDDLVVDLFNTETIEIGETTAAISGINKVKVGGGNTSVRGTTGNDSLVGYSGDDKDGSTSFWIGAGKDTVSGFGSEDKLVAEEYVTKVTADSNNVTVGTENGSVILENAANGIFNVNVVGDEQKAYVGENIVVGSELADYYNATSSKASIVATSDSGNIGVWLNQEAGANYGNTTEIRGDIKYIIAKDSSAQNTLVGSASVDNVIVAGSGYTSLWGGGASNDSLVAGEGVDTFFYMRGDGHDTIKGASSKDIVDLGNNQMSDIASTEVTSSSVTLNFTDGGTLQLNTNAGTKFIVQGETWTTDKSGKWTQG